MKNKFKATELLFIACAIKPENDTDTLATHEEVLASVLLRSVTKGKQISLVSLI